MKTLIIICAFLLLPFASRAQLTLDSAQVSKLIIKLNKLDEFIINDSLNTIIIAKKDSVIGTYKSEIVNHERINTNLSAEVAWLEQELARVKESGLKWFHYAGGGTLILVIGILTGLLIK